MTVALAFKPFAKASPCLTPFPATSDPSVLMRILAYIRGSLACRKFSQKKRSLLIWSDRTLEAHQIVWLMSGGHDCPIFASFIQRIRFPASLLSSVGAQVANSLGRYGPGLISEPPCFVSAHSM